MKRLLLCAIALVPLALVGCTDSMDAASEARERPLHVVCYSGGVAIVDDVSTEGVEWSDVGIYYRSRTTGRVVKAGADCVVIDEPVPAGWKPLLPGRTR